MGLHLVKEQRLSDGIAAGDIIDVQNVKGRYLGTHDFAKELLIQRLIVGGNDLSTLRVCQGVGQYLILDVSKLHRYPFKLCLSQLPQCLFRKSASLLGNDFAGLRVLDRLRYALIVKEFLVKALVEIPA